ncbi:MAG TPA: MEDS domain-containing protein [Candidatus Wunengus sp. YC63]|uniref:MEDS domain-containing protein n=1 Tax=unclassified Candidatus Wunengus TaxID=3367695 RepID=UPI00402A12A5
MDKEIRDSGIDIVGTISWGTHLCLFYKSRKDLVDILAPYFKAGLENNEFCMWVVSEPVSKKQAIQMMEKALPGFDQYLIKGQMEIASYDEWYVKDGSFDLQRVLNGWVDKHNQALARGYNGIRITGNTTWLEKKEWKSFHQYEEAVHGVIGKYNMIAICSYSLDNCGAGEVIDVVSNHQLAIIRREGAWEAIKRAEHISSETAGVIKAQKREIHVHRQTEKKYMLSLSILEQLNTGGKKRDVISKILRLIKVFAGFEAVAVRLREGNDFPYFVTSGFPPEFVEAERYLCNRDHVNELARESRGNPYLECMCGNVICGRTNPALPFFTSGGSFWTNSTTKLLADTTEKERQGRTRNRCNGEGYESVALIPIKFNTDTIGLLQLNDKRPGILTQELIQFLERISNSIGVALARCSAEEEVKQFNVFLNKKVSERTAKLKTTIKMLKGEIDKRKKAESKLLKFYQAIEKNQGIIFITDVKGNIEYVNPKFTEVTGYTFAEVEGKNPRILKSGETPPEEYKKLWSAITAGELWHGTFCNRKKSGDLYWESATISPVMSPEGVITHFIAVKEDITKLKRTTNHLAEAKQKLRKANERLHYILSKNPGIVYACGIGGDWPCISISENVRTVLGYEPHEFINDTKFWITHIHPEDVPLVLNKLPLIFENDYYHHEYRFMHKNGNYLWMHDELRLIRDEKGNPVECVGFWLNVTEKKLLEEQLRQSQKMEALGHFVGGTAHEFNNILGIIRGYTTILQQEIEEDTPAKKYAVRIFNASNSAASIIRRLLAFSKKSETSMKVLDLNSIVETTAQYNLKVIMKEDIEVKIYLATAGLNISADPVQIEQILLNLAINARDAMPDGGTFTIRTEPITIDNSKKKSPHIASGRYALMTVTDTGAGMEQWVKERMFEPFFTTKEVGKGTGLGLPIVFNIVKQHNGFMEVFSELGKGTVFKIYLPIINVEITVKDDEISFKGKRRQFNDKLTVLLAEDEEDLREITANILKNAGITVIEAKDGEDAVAQFKENKDKIQLVILDLEMPKMSGTSASTEIKKIKPDVKALFTSGYPSYETTRGMESSAELHCLSKPVDFDELLKKIRKLTDCAEF